MVTRVRTEDSQFPTDLFFTLVFFCGVNAVDQSLILLMDFLFCTFKIKT